MGSTKRTMAETAAYFEQHSVEQLFDELVKGLAAAKPADPKAWIAAQFESAAALTPEAVLQRIQNGDVGSTLSLAGEYGMDHEDFLGVIRSLSAEQYLTFTKMTTDITPEMMAKGSWKTAEFKKFNFSGDGVFPASGCLHPLLKVREECRNVFLEMGFEEMPTSRYVESSFWNFDSLFQPQQHPARDAHDTFFLEQPCTSTQIPTDYLERVRQVHQTGGFGSTGYQYEFSERRRG